MILQDVEDKYDKKNTLPFLANCKTRSLFWHLKNIARYELAAHIMCAASCYTCSIRMAVSSRVYNYEQ